MTSDWQLSLFPARGDDARAALHGFQAVARIGADSTDRLQTQIGEFSLLHVRPDVFDWVEFRRIRRQGFENELVVTGLDVAAHQAALMSRQAVPDDQQPTADLFAQGFEEFDELRAANRASEQPEVKTPEGDAGDQREIGPAEAVLQHWGLANRRPSANASGALGDSSLVYEDDGASLSVGFFLSHGQRLVFQRRIACSSRCAARPVGRWLEKPNCLSNLQTCTVLYESPNSFLISIATRGNVQSSVGNPFATAPATI